MAKKGGFPGGMPGNMNNLMKQAQRMQRQLEQNQKKLEEDQKQLESKEFTASSGGGAVSVTILGDRTMKSLNISPEAVDPDDVEMLQDMIIAAVNDAMHQIDEENAKLMEDAGGMGGGLGSLMGAGGLGGLGGLM